MTFRTFRPFATSVAVAASIALSPALIAQSAKQTSTPAIVPAVPFERLAPLLPDVPGWKKGMVDADRTVLSATCSYTFAYANYTNGTTKVRVTIADTGFDPGALGALATMVAIYPSGYTGVIPPSTSIARSVYKDGAAAAMWDAQTGEAEFTIVIGGRFVAKAEATGIVDPAVVRTMVDAVDVKALAELR